MKVAININNNKGGQQKQKGKSKATKKKGRQKKISKPLFSLFDDTTLNNGDSSSNTRPKRRRKVAVPFHSLSFDNKRPAGCKIGEGFSCPGCQAYCSYISRACDECNLECYYEAGVGVVILKERGKVSDENENEVARRAFLGNGGGLPVGTEDDIEERDVATGVPSDASKEARKAMLNQDRVAVSELPTEQILVNATPFEETESLKRQLADVKSKLETTLAEKARLKDEIELLQDEVRAQRVRISELETNGGTENDSESFAQLSTKTSTGHTIEAPEKDPVDLDIGLGCPQANRNKNMTIQPRQPSSASMNPPSFGASSALSTKQAEKSVTSRKTPPENMVGFSPLKHMNPASAKPRTRRRPAPTKSGARKKYQKIKPVRSPRRGKVSREVRMLLEDAKSWNMMQSQRTARKRSNVKLALPKKKAHTENALGRNKKVNSKRTSPAKLPEEFSGLDKELVEKIYSNVVHSGERVTFDDIAGLDDAKAAARRNLILPMKRPDLFDGMYAPKKGLLLFGPPGTGKTMIGKAIAYGGGATFFSISSESLTSKWFSEGEKLVRTLFEVAYRHAPSVIFFDEVDSLLTQRKSDDDEATTRIKAEFLRQFDGVGNERRGHVLFIGATNLPWALDGAVRRRFQERLYIPLPSDQARASLIRSLLKKMNHCLTNEQVSDLSDMTLGYSGADLTELCKNAATLALFQLDEKVILEMERKDRPATTYKHFCDALCNMNPSVAQHELVPFDEWNAEHGNRGCATNSHSGMETSNKGGDCV